VVGSGPEHSDPPHSGPLIATSDVDGELSEQLFFPERRDRYRAGVTFGFYPAKVKEAIGNCCSQRSRDMIPPLGPVQTRPQKLPATPDRLHVDAEFTEPISTAVGQLPSAICRHEHSISFEGVGQADSKSSSKMVVASTSLLERFSCDVVTQSLDRTAWSDRQECFDRVRDLWTGERVETLPPLLLRDYQSCCQELAQVRAG